MNEEHTFDVVDGSPWYIRGLALKDENALRPMFTLDLRDMLVVMRACSGDKVVISSEPDKRRFVIRLVPKEEPHG